MARRALVRPAPKLARELGRRVVFLARGAVEQVGEPAAAVALRGAERGRLGGAARGRRRKAADVGAGRRARRAKLGAADADGQRLVLARRAPRRLDGIEVAAVARDDAV